MRFVAALFPAAAAAAAGLRSGKIETEVAVKKLTAPEYERKTLPENVIPSHYELAITPNLSGDFKYSGEVAISVDVFEQTDTIVFNTREIDMSSVVYAAADGAETSMISNSYDEDTNFFSAKFAGQISPGQGTLRIKFTATHNDQMKGFYRSRYPTADGSERRIMVSTQFEAIDAREAFPCWDEPNRKATFTVTLIVDQHLTAISNMPIAGENTEDYNGKKAVQYEKSPKMSTYLLAFVVGEFDYLETQSKHGVKIGVYTPPGRGDEGRYALNEAANCLDLYDDYFAINYPLPKLDMVAIPEFSAGAMENWGLVTYREREILVKDDASASQMQRVAVVVNHELAHQWFGNLVTMDWWDDLWLNEGFASWCENFATQSLHEQYNMFEQMLGQHYRDALSLDSLRSSHPIQVPIVNAKEIDQYFDRISYSKGYYIVSMIRATVGDEAFQTGLQNYMQRHKYSNTRTVDLWNAWAESSGNPQLPDLASTWTEKMGYPQVTVTDVVDNGDNTQTLSLSQHWFLVDGTGERETETWRIPLFILVDGEEQERIEWFDDTRETKITIKKGSWVKINKDQSAPIRVVYTAEQLASLKAAIASGEMVSPMDRGGLLTDQFSVAQVREKADCDRRYMVRFDQVMDLLPAYFAETTEVVWDIMLPILNKFHGVYDDLGDERADLKTSYSAFLDDMFTPIYKQVGWEGVDGEDHSDSLLRESVTAYASIWFGEDESVQAEASRRFEAFMDDQETPLLTPSIRKAVFRVIAQSGEEGTLATFQNIHDAASDDVLKNDVLGTVGWLPAEADKRAVLDWAISGGVKKQDLYSPFSSVAGSSHHGNAIAWDYLKNNFDEISAVYGSGGVSSGMTKIITSVVGSLGTAAYFEEAKDFFEERKEDLEGNQAAIDQALESMEVRVETNERIMHQETGLAEYWVGLQASLKSYRDS